MSNTVFVRKAGIEDMSTIVDIGKRTFSETYSEAGLNGTLSTCVDQKFNEQEIEKELSRPFTEFYLAFANDRPVAFTKLRHDSTVKGIEGKKALEIERIYVLKEYQGVKVGKELMDSCIQMAIQNRYEVIWLQVWQRNNKAIRFYQKAGFVVFDTAVFNLALNIEQDDFLMRLDLYY